MTSPNAVLIVLSLLLAYYSLVVLGLAFGLRRLKYRPSQEKPSVSVIVAARNEEINMGNLLEHLVRQDYPRYEVVVVNDRSSDRTGEIIEQYRAGRPEIRRIDITSASEDLPAKKHALSLGIASSKGEILCFTDADCLPPAGWISSLVAGFDSNVGLVAGYSPYVFSTSAYKKTRPFIIRLFYEFIEYEEFKGATWAAGAIGLRMGWLCTGRSLAYRRTVFDELGGFRDIKQSVSGDDDLFLQLVRRKTSWQIRYDTAPESFVPTSPPPGFSHFIRQRVRHFSAGKYFPPSMKVCFLVFHAANLLLFLSLIGSIVLPSGTFLYWPYLAKCVVDAILFLNAARLFGQTRFAASFILMELIYILYNTFVGPLGFIRRIEWKAEGKS